MATVSTTTAASSASIQNNKVVWFWQSNLNPFDEKEKKEWTRYSDFEIEYIEQAYQRQEKEVQFNGYVINFKHHRQFNKHDRNRQRSVKREEVNLSDFVRVERFCYPERAVVKSFETETGYTFVDQWYYRNLKIAEHNKENWPAIAELAAQGILKEGKLLNRDFDAQRMAEQLRHYGTTGDELQECAVRLYSADSFLFKLLNSTMRSNDFSKVDTLGPFCQVLFMHLNCEHHTQEYFVYRGMTLTDEMIKEYKQAVGKLIWWQSFTSTSKDRRVAEGFGGNTLFIIRVTTEKEQRAADISSLSHYPKEQEVLFQSAHCFRVERIERELSGKYLIHMTSFW